MTDRVIRLPGTEGPDITIHRPFIGAASASIDGVPVPHDPSRRGWFAVPLPDGTTRSFRIDSGLSGQSIQAEGGERLPLDPPTPVWERILALAPMGLVVVGGLIGGAIGGLAMGVNLALPRTGIRQPMRAVAMLGVLAIAALTWLTVGTTIRGIISPIPSFAARDCVVGSLAAEDLAEADFRIVDCTSEHDGEVVGILEMPAGDYPGVPAIEASAETTCLAAFESFVGVPFDLSRLEMSYTYPSEETWREADRQLACIVYAPGGERLTGSVAGTAE